MKKETAKATIGNARGQKFDPPIEFEYSWNTYETNEELVAAKDELTLDEQRKVRNTERQNNARSKEQNNVLDKMEVPKPTLQNSPIMRLRQMYNALMATKLYTEEKAREMAATATQTEWPEGE